LRAWTTRLLIIAWLMTNSAQNEGLLASLTPA